jgi:hypothetical protein
MNRYRNWVGGLHLGQITLLIPALVLAGGHSRRVQTHWLTLSNWSPLTSHTNHSLRTGAFSGFDTGFD